MVCQIGKFQGKAEGSKEEGPKTGVGLVYPGMVALKGAAAIGTLFAGTPFAMG